MESRRCIDEVGSRLNRTTITFRRSMWSAHLLFEEVLSVLQGTQFDLFLLVLQLGVRQSEVRDEIVERLENLFDGQSHRHTVLDAQTVQLSAETTPETSDCPTDLLWRSLYSTSVLKLETENVLGEGAIGSFTHAEHSRHTWALKIVCLWAQMHHLAGKRVRWTYSTLPHMRLRSCQRSCLIPDEAAEEACGVADDSSGARLLVLTALQRQTIIHVSFWMKTRLNHRGTENQLKLS